MYASFDDYWGSINHSLSMASYLKKDVSLLIRNSAIMGWNAREEGIIKDQSISKIPEESLENQSRNFRNNLNALEVNHRKEIIELKAKFFDILEKMKS